jgi:hypothetical protein
MDIELCSVGLPVMFSAVDDRAVGVPVSRDRARWVKYKA